MPVPWREMGPKAQARRQPTGKPWLWEQGARLAQAPERFQPESPQQMGSPEEVPREQPDRPK